MLMVRDDLLKDGNLQKISLILNCGLSKGTVAGDFLPSVFSSINSISVPDKQAKNVSHLASYSPR
jgi:hypothetical protein